MDIAKIRKKLHQSEPEKSKSPDSGQGSGEQEITDTLQKEESIPPPSPPTPSEKVSGQGESVPVQKESKTAERKVVGEEKTARSPVSEGVSPEGTENIIEILTFKLLREDFAFRVSDLVEIIKFQHITPVPRVSEAVLGVTSLRGKVIPVIDLKAKLSLRGEPADDSHRRKILIIKGPKGRIGAAVDRVTGVVRIPETDLLPPPSHLSEEELKLISGVAVVEKRFVSILNMQEAITLSIK
jgi:purine-binding chemotaxis protein CheW